MSAEPLRGTCGPRFASVREAFQRAFDELGETGAALAVHYRGELVCDLWGGVADSGGAPWQRGTLVMPYSVSKPMAALCCLLLVDRGLLDPDHLVTEYWPEFGAQGKGGCTVRQLLEHRAGVPFVPPGCGLKDLLDWERLVGLIAGQAPLWPPGEVLAEHAITFGHLCAALVSRLTGESLGAFFDREVAGALGVDIHFGLRADRLRDCAELSSWPPATVAELRGMTEFSERGLFQPDVLCNPEVVNSQAWRQAEIPAVNMHGTAAGLSRVYCALGMGGSIGGTQLLRPETAALLRGPAVGGEVDRVFGFEAKWTLGFQRNDWPDVGGAPSPEGAGTFGLGGIGGSCAFGSADHGGVGYAYLTRQMGDWARTELVEEALRRALLGLGEEGR